MNKILKPELAISLLEDTYDVRLSVDTIHLSAKLDDYQEETMYDNFLFNKNHNKKWHWHYSQNDTNKLGFSIHSRPTNTYTYNHYNTVLMLQNQIIKADYIPHSLNELLHNIDWNVKRIDLAFDFRTPPENSLIIKHHGNVKFEPENDKWDTQYLGKLRSKTSSKVAFYDRNDKEVERETGIKHEYNNRFEVRLFPTCNDKTMKLHGLQDDFILKHLSKYIILSNINNLPLNGWDKNRLRRTRENYEHFEKMDAKKRKELRAVAKAHRVPLERIYLENKHKLMPFLKMPLEPLEKPRNTYIANTIQQLTI